MTRLFSFLLIGALILSFGISCKRADDSQSDGKEKKVQSESKKEKYCSRYLGVSTCIS